MPHRQGRAAVRWLIEVDCQPNADQLPMLHATIEHAGDFLQEALVDLGIADVGVTAQPSE